jgi:hypothetical protein
MRPARGRCRTGLRIPPRLWRPSGCRLEQFRLAEQHSNRDVQRVRKGDYRRDSKVRLAALNALKEADIQLGGLRKSLLRQASGTAQVAHVRPDITEDRADAGRVALHVGVRTPMFSTE